MTGLMSASRSSSLTLVSDVLCGCWCETSFSIQKSEAKMSLLKVLLPCSRELFPRNLEYMTMFFFLI